MELGLSVQARQVHLHDHREEDRVLEILHHLCAVKVHLEERETHRVGLGPHDLVTNLCYFPLHPLDLWGRLFLFLVHPDRKSVV